MVERLSLDIRATLCRKDSTTHLPKTSLRRSCRARQIGERLRMSCRRATYFGAAKKKPTTAPVAGRGKLRPRSSHPATGARFMIWSQQRLGIEGGPHVFSRVEGLDS